MTFPLEVLDDVRWRGVPVPGERQRTLLAAIVETSPTAIDRLIDQIWPDGAPDNAAKALQVVAVRARKATAPDVIERVGDGYRLALAPDDVDVLALLAHSDKAAAAADAGDWERARILARAAAGIRVGAGGDGDTSLGRLRSAATEAARRCRIIAGIAAARLGDHAEALDLLGDDDTYLDERVAVAVLRSTAAHLGVASALDRYARYRATLADRWGTDPGPEVERIHTELLAADRPIRTGVLQDATQLLGRSSDISELNRLVRTRRVVTILGPGGLGKTRLAHVIARAAEQPVVHFVELAGVLATESLWPTVVSALGRSDHPGRRGQMLRGDPDIRSRVIEMLAGPPTLLVLDNCEQIIAAAADAVSILIAALPNLTVLTTSRAPLSIAAEYCYSPTQLDRDSGVRLFTERALAARPSVSLDPRVLADLVERLDGLPLAIELAAARVRVLSPEQILERIDRRFTLLRAGDRAGPDRHRTLEAVIGWSWDLLSADDRTALARLSVFHDGFTLDAAAHFLTRGFPADGVDTIDVTDQLQRLVEQSLVTISDDMSMRFRMLETVREFGRDRLSDGDETDAAGKALRSWAVHLSRELRPTLTGPHQAAAMAAVRAEQTNLMTELIAAIDAQSADASASAVVTEIAATLFTLWDIDGDMQRAIELIPVVVGATLGTDAADEHADAARDVLALSLMFDIVLREKPAVEGREILRALGPGTDPFTSAMVIVVLNAVDLLTTEYEAGRQDRLETRLAALADDPRPQVALTARRWWSHRAESRGEVTRAVQIIDSSLALYDPAVAGFAGVADLLRTRASMVQQLGRFEEAAADARRALTIFEQLGSRYAFEDLNPVIAMGELIAGREDEAQALMRPVLADGARPNMWTSKPEDVWRAEVFAAAGDFAAARDLRRLVLESSDRQMSSISDLLGPVKPWLTLAAGAVALVAAARVDGGFDGDDLWARVCRELSAALVRSESVDYPVAGVAAYALGLWGASRHRCSAEQAANLVALAERMSYARNSIILDWSAGVEVLATSIPGALTRARDALSGVDRIELVGYLTTVVEPLVTALDATDPSDTAEP